ncbi:MAG: hypothetical protein ACLT3Y_01810 [Ruminococcus callidus]
MKWIGGNTTTSTTTTNSYTPMLTLNGDNTYTNITLDWTKCDYITNVGEVGIQFDKYPSNLKYDVYSKDYTQLASGQSLSKFMMNSNSAVTPSAAADKIVHLYCKGLSPEDISCSIVAPMRRSQRIPQRQPQPLQLPPPKPRPRRKPLLRRRPHRLQQAARPPRQPLPQQRQARPLPPQRRLRQPQAPRQQQPLLRRLLRGDHFHSHIHICCDIVLCKHEQYEYVCYNKYNYKYYSDDYHFCDGNFRQCGDNCGDRGEQLSSTDNSKL